MAGTERHRQGVGRRTRQVVGLFAVTALVTAAAATPASAGHNDAVVEVATTACGATTITASIDPGGGHLVNNQRLVVDVDGVAQNQLIPTDGSEISIDVGPFFGQSAETKTISWRVWGGGERDYDNPSLIGYGSPTFNADLTAYAASVGGFGWVISGTDDPNPFTDWHEVDVFTCAITKEMCKGGGYANFGFANQGQCIRLVNTGKDSR